MAGRRGWVARVVLGALVVAAAGCNRGSEATPRQDPTIPTILATTTTDPYAVPEVIDEAYVERVLAGLDAAFGDIVRLVMEENFIPPTVIARLEALYVSSGEIQLILDSLQKNLDNGFVNIRPEPGNQVTSVATLITARADCVFAEVLRDYSAVGVGDNNTAVQWIAIIPTPDSIESDLNQTTWSYIYDGFERGRTIPENPCD